LLCALTAWILLRFPKGFISYRALALTCFVGFGYWNDAVFEPAFSTNPLEEQLIEKKLAEIEGNVIQSISALDSPFRVIVKVTKIRYGERWEKSEGKARINIYYQNPDFRFGDHIRISKIRMKKPRSFQNPGQFNYQRYLKSQGISVLEYIAKLDQIEKIGEFDPGFFMDMRQRLLEKITNTVQNNFSEKKFGKIYSETIVYFILQLSFCGFLPPTMDILTRWPSKNSVRLKITLLDVAQGESIFIEFPNGKRF
jgi:predicted membrane metal-binding protein